LCNSSSPSICGVALSWKNFPQGLGVSEYSKKLGLKVVIIARAIPTRVVTIVVNELCKGKLVKE
jgi:hypothetical protein